MIKPEPAPEIPMTDLDKAIAQIKHLFSQDILAWLFALDMKQNDPEGFEILLEQFTERMEIGECAECAET